MRVNYPFGGAEITKGLSSIGSAVAPALWACFIVTAPCLYFAANTSGSKSFAFLLVGLLPLGAFVWSYVYLAIYNPDFLRSGKWQLQMESLKLFGTKDNPFSAKAGDVIKLVNNPEIPGPGTELPLEIE